MGTCEHWLPGSAQDFQLMVREAAEYPSPEMWGPN